MFSFTRNLDGTLEFIEKIEHRLDINKPAFINLRKVTFIDYGALVVLVSIMMRFKRRGLNFNGNFPEANTPKRLLAGSGFLDQLYDDVTFRSGLTKLKGRSNICTHASKRVNAPLYKHIIATTSKALWGKKHRCPGVIRTLIELTQNTYNHAGVESEGKKHWYLSYQHIPAGNKVVYSFVDYGVGIFQSLTKKRPDQRFYGWFSKLFDKHPFNNNAELLSLILEGKFHATVTKEYYRGKGLPGIYEAQKRGQISNLIIVSNNVAAYTSLGKYNLLNRNFSGTFVTWEVDYKSSHLQ